MKKILFISYFFPPIQSVESTMAVNSIKYLPDFSYNPVVIAAKRSQECGIDQSGSPSIPEEITVIRTFSWENWFAKGLNKLGIIPDSVFGWWLSALVHSKELMRKNNIEIIISRSNPVTSHLVALTLCKIYPNLRWVAMFGDPWSNNPYILKPNALIKKFRHDIERSILSRADKIIVTTTRTRDLFVRDHGFSEKIYILPNTYDPVEFDCLPAPSKLDISKIRFTYTGGFYGLRSPEPLFKALRLLKTAGEFDSAGIEIRLVGSMGEFSDLARRYKLEDIVQVIGVVPRRQALIELKQSDALLLIDAPSIEPSIFLPAKLVDYLAIQKPILGITPMGESADLINATQSGVVVDPTDPEGIAGAIKQFIALYHQGKLSVPSRLDLIKQYSAPIYAQRLSSLL